MSRKTNPGGMRAGCPRSQVSVDSPTMNRKTNGLRSIIPFGLLLFFWAISLTNLERWPTIHNDSVAILAAGHKLFAQGVYGLDMYTGHGGREQIYLEVMPLMSWGQGIGSHLWGLGVWQMRFLPVLAGLLTLALTYGLARALFGRQVGLMAMALLLFWRWAPGGDAFFGSGIALVDISRIARYDILTSVFSLAVLWSWLQLKRTGRRRWAILCGACAGLAGLAHLYGLFWLPALLLLVIGDGRLESGNWRLGRSSIFSLAWMGLGFSAVFAIWALMTATHWGLFRQQFSMHEARFALWQVGFYLDNLSREGQRYFLGIGEPGTWSRLGFWLVIAGLPLSLLLLLWHAWRGVERQAFWLWLPCTLFPLLFALLIWKKNFNYLMLVMPLWATAVAWSLSRLRQRPQRIWRGLVNLLLLAVMLEGIWGIGQMQAAAQAASSPTSFFAELRQALPPDAIVMGPQTYWFALPTADYRSFVLPFVMVKGEAFTIALEWIKPQVVVMNPAVQEWFRLSDTLTPVTPSRQEQWDSFLREHQAHLLAEIQDHEGNPVQIYQLQDN
jgi:4-amino-4-deoxy-L-arabinose transferase-like glycosyltransferase